MNDSMSIPHLIMSASTVVQLVMLSLLVSPNTTHDDAMQTLRLFGKYVIPYFKEKEKKTRPVAQQVSADN